MTEIRVDLLEAHPKQAALVNPKTRYTICRSGRRSGKTTGLAIRAIKSMFRGRRVMYAGPRKIQTAAFWDNVTSMLSPLLHTGHLRKAYSTYYLLGTEGVIMARTAWTPDALRGDYADDMFLDEWQLMDPRTWQEVAAPMLLDTGGRAWFCYTPPSIRDKMRHNRKGSWRHARDMFKAAKDKPDWTALHFTSHDNPHLDRAMLDSMAKEMTATAYRQEIMAEEIDEVEGALWTRDLIKVDDMVPDLMRVVVAVDPSGTTTGDEVGIVVAGVDRQARGWILEDLSLGGKRPDEWARTVVDAYQRWKADRIVAEVNFGGAMVESLLRTVHHEIAYRPVHASRGKAIRAEPVAALYEQGRVLHARAFEALDDEMCLWTPADLVSPNRLDAMVWALTDLMLQSRNVWGIV